ESAVYHFSIHPNPSKGKLKLTCDFNVQNEAYSILLSDLLGNEIETYELSEKISTLHLPDLSAGVYLLYLKGNANYLGVKKIILE
ncbi:MAG: T9SS type A sorting domain-containing protein, partial [Bacteroidetes bacterium]|nr:T9SS type A sorting domain-containing protein [Bacteroidota bacterium]